MKRLTTMLLLVISMSFAHAQIQVNDFSDIPGDITGGNAAENAFGSQGTGVWNVTGATLGSGFLQVATPGFDADIPANYQVTVEADLFSVGSSLQVALLASDFTTILWSTTFTTGTGNDFGVSGNMVSSKLINGGLALNNVAGVQFNLTGSGTAGAGNLNNISFTAVPEPSSFALMGLGMGALYLLRRRK